MTDQNNEHEGEEVKEFGEVDFTGASGWKEYTGGFRLVSHKGPYPAKIIEAKPGKSSTGNLTVRIKAIITEEGPNLGIPLYKTVPYTGNAKPDKQGKVRPNHHQLLSVARSCGMAEDKVQGLEGQKINVGHLVNEVILNANCFVDVDLGKDLQGRDTNDVKGFVSPDRYTELAKSPGFRTPIQPSASSAPNPAANAGVAGAAAKAFGVAAPAANGPATPAPSQPDVKSLFGSLRK